MLNTPVIEGMAGSVIVVGGSVTITLRERLKKQSRADLYLAVN